MFYTFKLDKERMFKPQVFADEQIRLSPRIKDL